MSDNVPNHEEAADRRSRSRSVRDVAVMMGVALVLLLLLSGDSVRTQGETMRPGIERDIVMAVGKPTGWIADNLPFSDESHKLTASLNPEDDLGSGGTGFEAADAAGGGATVSRVGVDAFDPLSVGEKPKPPAQLKTVLVTGDSMSQGIDAEIARDLAGKSGIKTERDPHVGTGISETDLVDWGKLSKQQVKKWSPQAVVMFMGANEGFPMAGHDCCGAAWAAEYATRARLMMDSYRAKGVSRVYWLLLPAPRDPDRQKISRTVNLALQVAAQPFRAQVRIVDMNAVFTPGGRFRSSMAIDGNDKIVRKPDGIHLNDEGSKLAAKLVLAQMARDFPVVK